MAKILIVEDDVDLVETYTDLLEARQHTVLSVPRASDAIQLVTRNKPDVLILDLNLPGESGVVVISFVRGYVAIAHTKIIVATGHPEIIEKAGYINSKIDAILTKPIANETLLQMIENFLALPSAS